MTVEAPQTSVETTSVPADESSTGFGGTNGPEAPKGKDEARFRQERNTARDALALSEARVEKMQTRELERIAGEVVSNPADLLALTGKTVADFLTDSGELDSELVSEAARELLTTRPGLRKNSPAFDPTQGHGGGAPPKADPSLGDLLKVGSGDHAFWGNRYT